MKERRRPSALNVETRGVASDGKGTEALDVRVIVDGGRAVSVGEGGNTKSVCDGVETMETGLVLGCDLLGVRRLAEGGSGFRAAVRGRR